MSHTHRVVIDNRGYRFTLPRLGFPDPEGDYATVEVAIFTQDHALLDQAHSCADPKPRLRYPVGEYDIIEVKHEGATWCVPILQPRGNSDPDIFRVKVRRVPTEPQAAHSLAKSSYSYTSASLTDAAASFVSPQSGSAESSAPEGHWGRCVDVNKDILDLGENPKGIFTRSFWESTTQNAPFSGPVDIIIAYKPIRDGDVRGLMYTLRPIDQKGLDPQEGDVWKSLPLDATKPGVQLQYVNAGRKHFGKEPFSEQEWNRIAPDEVKKEPVLPESSKPARSNSESVSASDDSDHSDDSFGLDDLDAMEDFLTEDHPELFTKVEEGTRELDIMKGDIFTSEFMATVSRQAYLLATPPKDGPCITLRIHPAENEDFRSMDYAVSWNSKEEAPDEKTWLQLPAYATKPGVQRYMVNMVREGSGKAPISREEWEGFSSTANVPAHRKKASSSTPSSSSKQTHSTAYSAQREPFVLGASSSSSSRNVTASAPSRPVHHRPIPMPGGGVGAVCECCADLIAASKGQHHLEPDLNLNIAFKNGLSYARYVDVLPKGDPVPARAKEEDPRLARPTEWAVNLKERTVYRTTSIPAQLRQMFWLALTKTEIGHPCKVEDGEIKVNFGLPLDHRMPCPSGVMLSNGPALLKVTPIPAGYACQPTSAGAEASYFLNHFKLWITQNDNMYSAYEPLAQDVHYNADSILSLLGQFASAEGSQGKMLFTAVPEALPGVEDVYNFGTRMRDGGARLPILSKGKDRKRIKMPGLAIHHSIYDGRGLSSGEVEGDQFKPREVNLRCKVPDGRQDLLLRVQEGQRGKFTRLELAFRTHGSFEPVDESGWRLFWDPLATRAIEEWAAMFLINATRLSFGTDKLFKPDF